MNQSQPRAAARSRGGGSCSTPSPARIRAEVSSRIARISAPTSGTLAALSISLRYASSFSSIQPRKASRLCASASAGGTPGSGSVRRRTSSAASCRVATKKSFLLGK